MPTVRGLSFLDAYIDFEFVQESLISLIISIGRDYGTSNLSSTQLNYAFYRCLLYAR